jgi:lactoylglutathione lyase
MKQNMPVPLTLFVVLLLCSLGFSQSTATTEAPEFDHAGIAVRDLQKSGEFYEKVMLLKRIPDPFNDGKHLWYRIGAHEQLHVIWSATEITHDIVAHMAFHVSSLPAFIAHLDQMQVKYRSFRSDAKVPSVRPDGVKQVYFQDPDGYWIEVDDHKF